MANTLQTGTEKLIVSLRKVTGETGVPSKQDFGKIEHERAVNEPSSA